MAGPTESGVLENLYSLLADYGVSTEEGVVVEADREHYAFQLPYVLLPDMSSSEITDSLIEEHYYPIMPISQALTVSGSAVGATVTELLTTSDASFSKVHGYDITTYEKEEGRHRRPVYSRRICLLWRRRHGLVFLFQLSGGYVQCIFLRRKRGPDHECPRLPRRRKRRDGDPQQILEL